MFREVRGKPLDKCDMGCVANNIRDTTPRSRYKYWRENATLPTYHNRFSESLLAEHCSATIHITSIGDQKSLDKRHTGFLWM